MNSNPQQKNKVSKNEPKLRFEGFCGEWREKKLGEVLKIGSGRDYKHLEVGDIPVFGTGGYMLSVDKALYSGETVFVGRKGTIDKPFYYNGKFWTVDTLFYTYDFEGITPKFTNLIFQQINWKKYNEASGVPSLSKATIEKIKINIPQKPEQQKIASFLTSVDEKIEQLKNKKSALEKYKKGIMQKIFSQQIRFKDENGKNFPNWEEKKLGEVCDYKNGGSFESDVMENGKYNLITLNSIDIKGNLKNNHKTVGFADWFLSKDDLIMVLSDVAHGNFLGLVDIIPENDKYVLNQRMGLLRKTDNNIDLVFLRKFINHNQRYFKRHGQGSSQQNLSKGDILKFEIQFPIIKEQQKIASFLTSLGKSIELKQQQITQAQQYKKGLMQGLFV
ncbi:restriction endonuclease subunit S [Patescibacteria group bacterium]